MFSLKTLLERSLSPKQCCRLAASRPPVLKGQFIDAVVSSDLDRTVADMLWGKLAEIKVYDQFIPYIAAGLGALGFDINYNYVTRDHGNRRSQGTSGSVGIAKAFGTAYAALLEANLERTIKLGNIGTICK